VFFAAFVGGTRSQPVVTGVLDGVGTWNDVFPCGLSPFSFASRSH
jgi:hypothetical protein